ncbi:Nitrate/nitrite transporter NarK [Dethiosulfatibacter aminovorans DSM 17477]|uniref:Nitrate/nitrite transporter NarK n=1 Tax=Dethiosulfatibacter aminovorans DSM 17477 TaxID=1121476 RepID=A0A1M6B279_9FIRM|nr:MFS transporter [Dethiosulfatibacter aminovorans]SHI42852.1 Nitrate/nitrite transporter NarK [Dethiosulfatibacter aminovorans DSM 17477]
MNNTIKKYLTIFALSLSGGSIFMLPYIKYVFYDHQIEVMGITNQQSGLLLSMYAIGCMALYIPGGIIADRFSAKKCIFWSLTSTTVLALLYAFTFNYQLSLVIWLLLAVTTCFVFWTALMKTLRMAGSDEEQGRIFGIYYAGNGITGAVVNSLALWASTKGADPRGSLFNAVMVMAAATAIAAVLIKIFLKDDKEDRAESDDSEKFDFGAVTTLIKNPIVWIFSLIIFCGYSLYSSTSYFTPYLTDVVGISPEQSGVFSIIRTYVFMLLAPIGGFLADKVFKSTSKWFMVAFTVLAILFWGVLRIPEGTNPTLISIITLLPGAFGLALYGILFSIIGEAKIPVTVTATAVGIASIIGYTPDLFMSAMFGTWLDKYGNGGYGYIFTFLMFVGVVGAAASYIIRRRCVKLESLVADREKQA